jgi:hypothetical protein
VSYQVRGRVQLDFIDSKDRTAFMLVIDYFSNIFWVMILPSRKKKLTFFAMLVARLENEEYLLRVRALRADNEFNQDYTFQNWLQVKGIVPEIVVPDAKIPSWKD